MEKKVLGKNQTVARTLNNELVIERLKREPLSGTELSTELRLSNATISSILNSLLDHDLIKVESQDSLNGLGRKRVKHAINGNYGLVVIVSLTSFNLKIVLSNLLNETLFTETKEVNEYDVKTFYETVIRIKDILLLKQFRDTPLRNIILSVPGLVNVKTGELQFSPQFSGELFNNSNYIEKIFTDSFNCPVYLDNDTKLMMLGELSHNSFFNRDNGMLVYLDLGIGGAFEFNKKLFLGSRGYAGEFGLIEINVNGEPKAIDDLVSLRAIKENLKEKYQLDLTIYEIIKSYKNGDSIVKNEVLESAKILAYGLSQVVKLFDIDTFLLTGRVSEFGDEYIKIVREYLQKINKDIVCEYSTLGTKAIIDGAKVIGSDYIISKALKDL